MSEEDKWFLRGWRVAAKSECKNPLSVFELWLAAVRDALACPYDYVSPGCAAGYDAALGVTEAWNE